MTCAALEEKQVVKQERARVMQTTAEPVYVFAVVYCIHVSVRLRHAKYVCL